MPPQSHTSYERGLPIPFAQDSEPKHHQSSSLRYSAREILNMIRSSPKVPPPSMTPMEITQEPVPKEDIEPLLKPPASAVTAVVRTGGGNDSNGDWIDRALVGYSEFWQSGIKLGLCFLGLQISYLTWGVMQEKIMTTVFTPTPHAQDGKFPSAAFCVFSNRLLAVIVAMIMVRIRHGAIFANNRAPLYAFCPPAFSNTISSWSQYRALSFVSFPEQTVFKSSKVIAVMMMGKVLNGKTYPWSQYAEAFFITLGVAIFSLASKEADEERESATELYGLFMLILYVSFDSFTSQYQDKVYKEYGKENVDPFQMMLGVNVTAIAITSMGLILTRDFVVVAEFLWANPIAGWYNILTAITSASGQICIFYTIQQFGPIIFTVIMTTRQMLSICLSAALFGHNISLKATAGALLVFGVIFDRIRRKYKDAQAKKAAPSEPVATNSPSQLEQALPPTAPLSKQ